MAVRTDELIGQFVLAKSRRSIPGNWPVRSNGAWHLGHHPALPVMDIRSADSIEIGWLVGYPISPEGQLLTENVECPVSANDGKSSAGFEAWLYEHGGRFAAIYLDSGTSRFYLDPCGSLAAVFCPQQELVASTPALVPYAAGCEDNEELIRALGIPERNNWFPFGCTPRLGVERLLPNHFLDLRAWESVRHWPTGELPSDYDVREAASEIATILKRHIAAVARQHPIHMSLTAGRDSRMLLACAREHLDGIAFFTLETPRLSGPMQCQVGRKLAKTFRLRHIVLPFEPASERELEEWRQDAAYDRTGLSEEYVDILGVKIPYLRIPIRPGRNIAIIIEVAALNHRLKEMGINPAQQLNDRILNMNRDQNA